MKVFAVLSGYVFADCGENEELLDGTCYQLGILLCTLVYYSIFLMKRN